MGNELTLDMYKKCKKKYEPKVRNKLKVIHNMRLALSKTAPRIVELVTKRQIQL